MPQYVFKYVGVDSDGDLGILSRRLPLEQITALRTGEQAAAAAATAGSMELVPDSVLTLVLPLAVPDPAMLD